MSNIKHLVRKNILTLKPYSSARDEFEGKEGIFLDANENPYGQYNRYPDPYQRKLKERLASLKGVNPKNIFVGNGSDEVIDLAFRIFCNPEEDKVLTFSPTYGMYEVSANINDITLIKLPLKDDFQIDVEALKPYYEDKKLKIIFICSPNNPTGNLINHEDIIRILESFPGIVIIDEAYIDFAESPSCIHLLDRFSNLIISQTFSKAWGLAAVRVGLAYASLEIIALYNKIKPPYNISGLNQEISVNSLNEIKTFEENKKRILSERKSLMTTLENMKIINKVYPTDANFILIEVDNPVKIYQKLLEQGVIIRDRSHQIPNCLRISVGTQEENKILINALKNLS